MLRKNYINRYLKLFFTVSILCLSLLLVQANLAFGQRNLDVNFNFMSGFPRGEFKDNADNPSFGGSFSIGYNFPEKPFVFGFDLSYAVYGNETGKINSDASSPVLSCTNKMLLGHFFLRIQKDSGIILPYCEGLLGFNYLFTDIPREDANIIILPNALLTDDRKEISSDWALSYGIGGGIKIKLHDFMGENSNAFNKRLFLNINTRYLFGSTAEHLRKEGSNQNSGDAYYTINNSRTNIVFCSIGISVDIWD